MTSTDLSNWKFPNAGIRNGKIYETPHCAQIADNIIEGDVNDFDVLMSSYPRSGSTLLMEVCWQLLHDCDVDRLGTLPDIHERTIYIDNDLYTPKWNTMERPIIADTHAEFSECKKLVERDVKVVVAVRNPKDTLVWLYHFFKKGEYFSEFPGNFHQFMDLYRQGVFPHGDYFESVLPWWNQKERDNVLIVRYEDFKVNPIDVIKEISLFLGKNHNDEKLEKLAKWASPVIVGDWKNYFNEEENTYVDTLCKERCDPVKLEFIFE